MSQELNSAPKYVRVLVILFIVLAVLFFASFLLPAKLPVPMRSFQVTSPHGGLHGEMVLLPDGAICAADYKKVYALDPAGRELWSSEINLGLTIWPDISAGPDHSIYVSALAGLNSRLLINVRDGAVLSQYQYDSTIVPRSTSLLLPDGSVCLGARHGIITLNPDGSEKWRFATEAIQYRAPALTPDGGLFFTDSDSTNSSFILLNSDGTARWRRPTMLERHGHVPAFSPDGSFYCGSGTNVTLAAFDSEGRPRWQLGRPEFAISHPAIAPDGTIYLIAREPRQEAKLLAVEPGGTVKWTFGLGPGFALDPPAIHPNGTLFLVTRDRWIRAISPEGKLEWKFQVPPKRRLRRISSWNDFTQQVKEGFGSRRNESHGPPLLSPDGILYVNFSHTGTIYAFEVGTSPR